MKELLSELELMAVQKKIGENNCEQRNQTYCKTDIVVEMNVVGLSCLRSDYCSLCYERYCGPNYEAYYSLYHESYEAE